MEQSLMNILKASVDKLERLILSVNKLNETLTSETPTDALLLEAEINSSKLETCLNKLKGDLNNYFRHVNDPAIQEISDITTVQLEAEEVLCELKVKIKHVKPSTSRDSVLPVTGKLPKLCLPEFDGDVLNWTSFWDQFESQVGSRRLSDVDKLLYLNAALKGDAKKLIEGLGTTNKNYEVAVATLKDRYGKTERVKDAHHSALNRITPAGKSITECRRVFNDIELHLRMLSALGEDITHSYLRPLILGKFPEDLIYELMKRTQSDSIEEIRKELNNLISAREEANRITKAMVPKEKEYSTETLHIMDRNKRENFRKGSHVQHRRGGKDHQRFDGGYPRRSNTQSNQRYDNATKHHAFPKPSFKRKYEETRSSGAPFSFRKDLNKRMKGNCLFCNGGHLSQACLKFKTFSQRKAQLEGCCYMCLKPGHKAAQCYSHVTCQGCKQKHHTALCHFPPTSDKDTEDKKESDRPSTTKEDTKQLHVDSSSSTILQTAVVRITRDHERNETIKCRALLDSGSQRTYVTQRLAKELNLAEEEKSKLLIYTFGAEVPQEVDSPRVKLQIITRNDIAMTLYANVVPSITNGIPYSPEASQLKKERIDLADDGSLDDTVDLLIGNDYYFSLILNEKVQIQDNLHIVNSVFGWILSGKTDPITEPDLSVITYFQTNLEVKLNQPDLPLCDSNCKQLWELETIGISDSPKETREEEAIKQFNENAQVINNRYQVTWPWIEYPPALKDNYGLALGRLVGLMKRLNSDTLAAYDQLIREQEHKGIVEIVPEEEIKDSSNPIHYLPHHGVKQPNKPIRIVYDASSKTKESKSLNQCLYCGPLMLEDLTGLLLRFRFQNVGICADVEKAFLQIGLQARDRDVTRFLWVKNIELPVNEDNLLHLRFCRVPFGVIASPFLLNATIKHHLSQNAKDNIKELAQHIYVDNVVTGTNTVEEAVDLYSESKRAFQQISMNLRDWSSNSEEFIRHVPDACQDEVVKVLGLNWTLKNDTLHLRINDSNYADTKRGILRSIASVYDPCGFTAPSLLAAKLLLQDLWKEKAEWDSPLSKENLEKWKEIQKEMKQLKEICIPRCYFTNSREKSYQIHCFTDASMQAYAAVVYITQGDQKSFVIGKSRLNPIKDQENLKIPRLELLGALIGTRLIKYVLRFLQGNVTHQFLWIDSQIVIDWYHTSKLLSPFVTRRIEEIRKNKSLTVRYVPTSLNPADVATRPAQLTEDKDKWLKGPDFITKDPSEWPIAPRKDTLLLAGEGLSDTSEPMQTDVNLDTSCGDSITEDQISDTNSKKVTPDDNQSIIYTTVEEIKKVQAEHFPEELAGKETSMRKNLDLFKDEDGILRSKGRLGNADWTYDKRYPILIPNDSEFTRNIIMKTHTDNYHVGAPHTLSIIRQTFWIPQGRSRVTRVINKCPQCVKHGGGPFKLPPTPALPPERVNYSKPYAFTGIDYLGPLLVGSKDGTEKRWICLFTCLAIRAVHLEVVRDLTAEEGLLAVRRFISTRIVVPEVITSDNATNFKLMSEVLTKPYCVARKIKWRFIPQLAPWFGGYYERLVGIVKNCLRRTLQKHLMTDNQLNTVIKEIEAVINSRPLTYVDSEPGHILKPSDFIAMGRTISMGSGDGELPTQGTQTKMDLISSWKRGITILNEFKDMFVNQYLLSLRERYSHSHKQPRCTSKLVPREGQTVQIKGDDKNREGWRVGKISSLTKGADGMVGVAKVKVGDKEFTRSIAQLYPLEVDDTEDVDVSSLPLAEMGAHNVETSVEMEIDTPEDEVEDDRSSELNEGEKEILPIEDDIYDEGSQTDSYSPDDSNASEKMPDDFLGVPDERGQRRAAATKALEKIRRWTRCLVSLQ